MAKLKKLILTETKRDVSTNINTQLPDKDSLEKQLEKFSTSYSSAKLDNLYDEYEKVDLTKEEIETSAPAKVTHMSFKKGLAFGTIFVVTVLFMFLCIYNIVVINKYSSSIDMLQRDVAITSENLNDVQTTLDERLNSSQIETQLQDAGYSKQSSSTTKVPRLQKQTSNDSSGPSNWFDKFCNFIAKLFGKN